MRRKLPFVGKILVASLLGVLVGVVSAASEFLLWPPVKRTGAIPPFQAEAPLTGEPKAVVESLVFDFGVLDEHAVGEHQFVIRNEGSAPLRIEEGSTTCRCTSSLVGRKEIPPGEKSVVTVKFDLKGFSGPYSQSVTVLTNDKRNPRIVLTVRGKVTKAVQAVPSELVLTRIAAGQRAATEFLLLGFRPTPLNITSWSFEDPSTAQHFSVELRPLDPAELGEHQGATGGVLGILTIRPGLPLGAFSQKLVLKTNYPEAPEVTVPIRGTVASEISVVAGGWDEGRSLLRLGTFRRTEGLERRIFLRVSRTLADRVHFTVEKVFPEFVEVEIGSAAPIGDAPAMLVPVVLRFPKGCPAGNYLGIDSQPSGYILFRTGVAEAPELKVNLSFLIEG
jgi:hypothetical protein